MRFRRTRRFIRWVIRAVVSAIAIGLIAAVVFVLRCRGPVPNFQPSTYSEQNPQQAQGIANYARPEQDTFYSYPEWYIVWSYQAKADFQRAHLPSRYTYFGDIAQYWGNYCCVYGLARKKYPIAWAEHVMLVVIGTSFSIEYTLKGAYEHSIGRVSEWTSRNEMTTEDSYAAEVAEDYAQFVHVRPFYEYSFARALHGLWARVPLRGSHWFRKAERRSWLTLDYGIEAIYCEVIELGTHLTYGHEDTNTSAWVTAPSSEAISRVSHVKVIRGLGNGNYIVEIPRYQEFTSRALEAVQSGANFVQVAGNQNILVSVLSDHSFNFPAGTQVVRSDHIPSEPQRSRTALLCRVGDLGETLRVLESQGVNIEHIYDF